MQNNLKQMDTEIRELAKEYLQENNQSIDALKERIKQIKLNIIKKYKDINDLQESLCRYERQLRIWRELLK